MAVTAAAAAWGLRGALRSARRHGDLDGAALLTAAMGLLIVAPIAAVAFSGGLDYRLDIHDELTAIFPSWYHRGDQLAKILVVGVAVVVAARQILGDRARLQIAALLGVTVCALAGIASGLHGEPIVSLSSGTLIACLLAAVVLPRGRGGCTGAGVAGVMIAIASGVLAVVRPGVALLPCTRKCSVIGSLLAGVVPNVNLLGMTLAASIPFVYLGFRGRERYGLIAYLMLMTAATGARTSMAAAAVAVVVLILVRPDLDGREVRWPANALPWVVAGAALAAWLFLVTHRWAATALTDRGVLWTLAKRDIGQAPWFGHGPASWADLYRLSEIPATAQRSSHSELLDVLYTSGYVGAGLITVLLATTIVAAGRARSAVLIALGTIMIIGATEGTWQVATFDFMSFTLVALILTGEAATATTVRTRRAIAAGARRSAGPVPLREGAVGSSAPRQ